ncbi:hypothetical protein BMF94_0720 [Rhodotorula taiwanensis]|uniref:EVE domain-containing protein n=1 Tax=Rhodotorula taiwanensis TaxID=741276 RepID=A0A2S5BHE9_9BASI|nr:hypothetical protein BMF94_0720 [Rhodotorula taiwanensis]
MAPDKQETHWLIKAEPDSRIEKGIDVRFSIDDLEQKRTTTWEGVRNHQAKNFLRDRMKLGHECLFYASNCKEPGIRGLARVCKEGYPDYNAWDPKHPYYDPKSKEDDPTWYMVDVEFISKLAHPIPLALLQLVSRTDLSELPSSLSRYLTASHLAAIRSSALLSRGRLSVQPVSDELWEACVLMGDKGGWEEWDEWTDGKGKNKAKGKANGKGIGKGKGKVGAESDEESTSKVTAKKEEEDAGESGPRSKKRANVEQDDSVQDGDDDDDNDDSESGEGVAARSAKPAAKKNKVKKDEVATPTGRRNPRRGKA